MAYTVKDKQILNKIDKVSKGFQESLNNRLAKMSLKDVTGEEYEEKTGNHPFTDLYFVQRDEHTIELWKGDVQISGKGGDGYEVTSALLLESSNVAAVTGGVNGEIFMTVLSGDNEYDLQSASYGNIHGEFQFTTRGRQGGQRWEIENSPSNGFNILYNRQVAYADITPSGSGTNYVNAREDAMTRYPKYVLEIIRPSTGVRETLTYTVGQLSTHTGWMPQWTSGQSYVTFPEHYTYQEAYDYMETWHAMSFRTMLFVSRNIHDGPSTYGFYYSTDCGGFLGMSSILSVNIKDIHYDSTLGMVIGTPYMFHEYSKEDSICGQLGLRRDLETGELLPDPKVIFNVDNPQMYQNEFIMYKLLKGESIV